VRIGFGLDLAGYTTNKTTLSVIEANGKNACVTLLTGTVFSLSHASNLPLEPIVDEESEILRICLTRGRVAVDVPIDLQGLLSHELPQQIWGLTCRPIDKKLGALRALADRLGSAVARFKAIMLVGEFEGSLGNRLFETYPAASLKATGCDARNYKNDSEVGRERRNQICNSLRFTNCSDLNDDDIDSVICAMTALKLDKKPPLPRNKMPRGYRLLQRPFPFEKVTVKRSDFSEWIRGAGRK
jgi:hypothetical protein